MRKILFAFFFVLLLAAAFFYFRSHLERNSLTRAASDLESLVSTERIQKQITELASKPHRAGTIENRAVGDSIIQRLKSAGFDVTTSEYQVEFPEPVQTGLKLTYPESIEFAVQEKAFSEDSFSEIAKSDIPYFAYSPDARVEGDVVYANFGSKQDFDFLRKNGIDVTGKIALVRAQGICRGMKLLNAEQAGVAALLLFPELRDQGFKKAPYPEGPHMNPWVIQRGSMLKFFLYPGDPGVSSALDQTLSTLPRIPAIPISEQIAMELLKRIHGSNAPQEWRGWLPVDYPIGAGPARVQLTIQSRRTRGVLRNIFATIPGTNPLEPMTMAGGHYDAWVYGAADPSSGTTVLLEAADALAQLHKKWWKPKRSLLFAFWDAEEFGLFGSTKWVESFTQKGDKKVAAYVNVDTAVKGQDFAGYLAPGLQKPLDDVLSLVQHPMTGESLLERRGEFVTPGFSDDTGPFTGIAGIPVAEIHFGRYYPMYHSLYDDLTWMSRFNDPGYKLEGALSKVLSLYLLKLSGDEIFPFHFEELSDYARKSLKEMIPQKYDSDQSVRQKVQTLNQTLSKFDQAAAQLSNSSLQKKSNEKSLLEMNLLIVKAIAAFTRKPDPGEPFQGYARRNALLGPSEEDGCAGQQLPGLNHAILSNDIIQIQNEIDRLSRSFEEATQFLLKINSLGK
jgi:N-acetylated-alpha-linked acidic dipeptidase